MCAVDDPEGAGDLGRPPPLPNTACPSPVPHPIEDAEGVEQQFGDEAQHVGSMATTSTSSVTIVPTRGAP
jgi:hypothetical protein